MLSTLYLFSRVVSHCMCGFTECLLYVNVNVMLMSCLYFVLIVLCLYFKHHLVIWSQYFYLNLA